MVTRTRPGGPQGLSDGWSCFFTILLIVCDALHLWDDDSEGVFAGFSCFMIRCFPAICCLMWPTSTLAAFWAARSICSVQVISWASQTIMAKGHRHKHQNPAKSPKTDHETVKFDSSSDGQGTAVAVRSKGKKSRVLSCVIGQGMDQAPTPKRVIKPMNFLLQCFHENPFFFCGWPLVSHPSQSCSRSSYVAGTIWL